jgi:putative transcriptional regulator
MRPRQIKKIRKALGASQSVFALILNVSPKVVQSWEHGARRPTNAALKLLSIAQTDPQILLPPKTDSAHRPVRRKVRIGQ